MSSAFEDDADYVVIGTGAGGATAARVLAAAGRSVLMLEEGPALRPEDRPIELLEAMAQAMRGAGTWATAGGTPMPLLQGRCVGGSTAINSGIIWRMPEDVRVVWAREYGLADLVADAPLDAIFARIEEELEVAETAEEVRGGNADRMAHACRALGLPGRAIRRNAARCKGRARCLQGCPERARQSMDVSYVPRALGDGARLHTGMRVDRILVERGVAVGVEGTRTNGDATGSSARFRVRARRAVVLAAGAIHSPTILLRSGLRGLVGHRFQAHPGAAIVGRFDASIGMGQGATQAYEVPLRDRGYKLESLSLPAEMLAARLPGVGAEWQTRLASLDACAQWASQVRMEAHGRVRLGFRGEPIVRYEPTPRDLSVLQESLALLSRMMFAAGAVEVYPGLGGVPEVLTSVGEVDEAFRRSLPRRDFHLVASHLFGTACAGDDPKRSVVGPTLESHAIAGLFVMDASVFPTNLGVNPQHSIMAIVTRAAEWLANAEKRPRSIQPSRYSAG